MPVGTREDEGTGGRGPGRRNRVPERVRRSGEWGGTKTGVTGEPGPTGPDGVARGEFGSGRRFEGQDEVLNPDRAYGSHHYHRKEVPDDCPPRGRVLTPRNLRLSRGWSLRRAPPRTAPGRPDRRSLGVKDTPVGAEVTGRK